MRDRDKNQIENIIYTTHQMFSSPDIFDSFLMSSHFDLLLYNFTPIFNGDAVWWICKKNLTANFITFGIETFDNCDIYKYAHTHKHFCKTKGHKIIYNWNKLIESRRSKDFCFFLFVNSIWAVYYIMSSLSCSLTIFISIVHSVFSISFGFLSWQICLFVVAFKLTTVTVCCHCRVCTSIEIVYILSFIFFFAS